MHLLILPMVNARCMLSGPALTALHFQPFVHWLRARLALLSNNVDEALKFLKLSLDKDPFNMVITEDLLKVACSGKVSSV